MATKWLTGKKSVQHGDTGQKDDSHPGDRAGQQVISSHFSDWHTI